MPAETPTPREEMVLAPCPFCGHDEAEYQRVENQSDENFGGMFVECRNCHVCTPLIFPVMDDVRPALSDIWNRRTPTPSAAVEQEEPDSLFRKVFGGPYQPRVHQKYAAAHADTIRDEIAKLEAAGMVSAVDVIAALVFWRDIADERAKFMGDALIEREKTAAVEQAGASSGEAMREAGIPQSVVRDLMKRAGYDDSRPHPDCYTHFSWITFSKLLFAVRAILGNERPPPERATPQRIAPRISMTELDARERAIEDGFLKKGNNPLAPPAPVETASAGVVEALRDLEDACNEMAGAIPADIYNAMTDRVPGMDDLRDRMDAARRAARTALTAAQPASGGEDWQPIETAPKGDGRFNTPRIQLWTPTLFGGMVVTGRFSDDGHSRKPRPYWGYEGQDISTARAAPPT
ncbi:Lar family restriction alleviation protein, partial [Roseomonas chloroacetimidivorans]|uniref:Lar family restriction alleviation protein n=1 Tax=Roseomonas chloroacetimidivorans TaxID=1766656 RepID=UPI003C775CCE